MVNKKFWTAAFTLSGAIIGAGILGLPYVFSKAGFLVGIFWLVVIGGVMTLLNLSLAKTVVRTKENHQLIGYAEKYLGKCGKIFMSFALLFGIYSALIAYLVGESQSFGKFFSGINPLFFGVIFWLAMTLLLSKGLKNLKKIETFGVISTVMMILILFVKYLPKIKLENLLATDFVYFAFPVGTIMFSLIGFVAIPELRRELKGQEKLLKKAVLVGSLIPIVLYILFTAVFVGFLGSNISQVATISMGLLVTLIGIFTMATAFYILSFSLKDSLKYDLKISRKINFFLTSVLPLILYIVIVKSEIIDFSKILSIGGAVSAGLTGILIILMNKEANKND